MASHLTNTKSKLQSANDENQSVSKTPAKTAKKRGRPPKKTPTTRELLYKEETILKLPESGIEVVYVPPGIQQKGNIVTFMINTLRPLVMTDEVAKTYKKEELTNEMFKRFNSIMTEASQQRKASIIAMMLLDAENKHFLYEMISECFPGIDPSKLKEEIYVEIFTHFVDNFNKTILGVET